MRKYNHRHRQRAEDWEIREQVKNGGLWAAVVGCGWHTEVVSEKERAENEYSMLCFNLKQRCFQENEFQWSWAKNNYRDFLVLFCEWRASLFSGDARVREHQSQRLKGCPSAPLLPHSTVADLSFFLLPKAIGTELCWEEREVAAGLQSSWIFYSNNSLFTLIMLKYWNWEQDWDGEWAGIHTLGSRNEIEPFTTKNIPLFAILETSFGVCFTNYICFLVFHHQ